MSANFDAVRAHLARFNAQSEVAEEELYKLLLRMEGELAASFSQVTTLRAGGTSAANLRAMEEAMSQYQTLMESILTVAESDGMLWADKWATMSAAAGIESLQLTLAAAEIIAGSEVKALQSAFDNFAAARGKGVIEVGRGILIRRLDGVKTDTLGFLREKYISAMVEGLPVAGSGDTLATRLFEGNRIKDLTITDKAGRTRVMTAETRSQAIARTELTRIRQIASVNEATELGLDKYLDVGPLDDRTSDICVAAFAYGGEEPHTLEEWEAGGGGVPPRHPNCRHELIPVSEDWV